MRNNSGTPAVVPLAVSRVDSKKPVAPAAPYVYSVAAFLLLLSAIAAHWQKVDSSLLLFHLQTGEVIQNTGQVPNRDIFSATASVDPWAYIEWLWSRLLALVFAGAEWAGVNILSIALVAATAAFGFIRSRTHGSRAFESVIVLTMAVVILVPVWQPSSSMAVIPLFALALILSESRKPWPMVLLPPMVTLWANLHPAFLLPLLAPLMRLLTAEKTFTSAGRFHPDKPRMLLIIILSAGVLCALLTPHSVNVLPAMLKRLGRAAEDFAAHPARHFANPAYLWQLMTAVLFTVTAIAGKADVRRWQLASCLSLAALALTVLPDAITFLLIFTIAPASLGLTTLLTGTWRLQPVRHFAATALLLVNVLAMPALLLTSGLAGKAWGTGIRDGLFPETAAGRLSAIPLRGSIFNQSKDGGYLIWRLWPGWRVCADERSTLYSREFRQQYDMMWQGAAGWEAMFSLWRVYAVLGDVDTATAYPDHNLYYELAASPDWVAVYWDNKSILYIKEGINLTSTNLAAFRQLKPGISWHAMKARINSQDQWLELAADLRRALMDDPTNTLAQEFLRLTEAEL